MWSPSVCLTQASLTHSPSSPLGVERCFLLVCMSKGVDGWQERLGAAGEGKGGEQSQLTAQCEMAAWLLHLRCFLQDWPLPIPHKVMP